MEINEKFLFLGTNNGFCRINIKTGQIRNYNYPFIGQVNELILDDNILWVGSNNGLIKFKWKKRYMKFFIVFILITFLINEKVYSQLGKRAKANLKKIDKFSLSSFAYASHSDSMKLVSYLEIPYSVLQFVKINNNYVAYYQVSISAVDANGIQLEQFVLRDSIVVDDYVETKSWMLNRKHFSTFIVPKKRRLMSLENYKILILGKKD